mgnify:CR=1 FL=1
MRLSLLTLLIVSLLGATLPVQAQETIWCRAFDFTKGQQGWSLSYSGQYGRYTNNAGFSVSQYGSTTAPYDQSGSIRIHLDFSGTVRQLYIYSNQPDLTHVFVDWNSEITDGEAFDDDLFTVGPASPVVIAFNPTQVTGRLGLEIVKLHQPLPMTTVITGLILTGSGANPFGSDNCAGSGGTGGDTGNDMPFDVDLNAPIPQLFEALATANAAVNSLPTDLTAPSGSPLLPSTDGTQLFAYAKWLLSPAAAEEYAGPFAPILQHLGIAVSAMFALILIYVGAYVVNFGMRFVLWIAIWAFKLIDLIFQAIQAGGSVIIEGARFLMRGAARVLGL